jgi:RES domain-containing protein
MVEYFVHVHPDDLPDDLVIVPADVPDDVSRATVGTNDLPANWRQSPAPPALAGIGDAFVADGKAGVLIVPSALAPAESNWLINPRHPAFRNIRVLPPDPFSYDARFFKRR